jgi:hypothetical protein
MRAITISPATADSARLPIDLRAEDARRRPDDIEIVVGFEP